jgi:hypothetical protein
MQKNNYKLHNLHSFPKRVRWAEHLTSIGKKASFRVGNLKSHAGEPNIQLTIILEYMEIYAVKCA